MKAEHESSIMVAYDCIPCAIGSLITLFKNGLVSKEKQEQTIAKKISEKPVSAEVSQRLIKSVQKEIERKPTQPSKVLSSNSQIHIKTVAFGKVPEVEDPEPREPQRVTVAGSGL